MKGICIYKSKYGATAQYASWLGEALYLPVLNIDDQHVQLDQFDYVVIGSPVYVGKLLIKEWLEKNAYLLQNKKVFLFVVSSSGETETQKHDHMIQQNVPAPLQKAAEFYFLPGRVIISKLSWFDKLMVSVGSLMENDPLKKAMIRRGFDAVKRVHINALIKTILTFSNSEILS